MTIAIPPPVLWITGNPQMLLRPMVAIVGARNASSLAQEWRGIWPKVQVN